MDIKKVFKITKTKLNIINVVIFGALFCIVLVGGHSISQIETMKKDIYYDAESQWRDQAKAHIEHTVNLLNTDIRNGYVSPFDTNSITKWVEENYIGSTNVGVHSNTLVNELESGEMISGSSTPLFIIEGDNDDPVTKVISDNKKEIGNTNELERVIKLIQSGKSPGRSDRLSYDFDGRTEWVEYNYYPPRGVLESTTEENLIKKRFVFVVTVKEDTILNLCKSDIIRLNRMIKMIYTALIMVFILGVVILTVLLCKYFETSIERYHNNGSNK